MTRGLPQAPGVAIPWQWKEPRPSADVDLRATRGMPQHRMRALALSALFAAIIVAAIADLLGTSFVFGAPVASALLWPAAGVLLGLAWHRAGRLGARPILLSAAIMTLVITGAELFDPAINDFREPPGGLLTLAVAAVFAVVAALAAATIPRLAAQEPATIVRSAADRAVALVLVVLGLSGVVFVLADVAGSVEVAQLENGVQTVVSVVHSDWVAALVIGLVAWWWGSGWLLALGGLATIAAIPAVPPDSLTANVVAGFLLGVGSVFAGLRPPGGRSKVDDFLRGDRTTRRPTVAAVWALSGSLLLIPTLLYGRFPIVSIDCFDECAPLSPLAGPSAYIDLALVVLVPVAALMLAFAPTARAVTNGSAAFVGVLAAVLILIQIVLGQLETSPFWYMGVAAPATVLILVGFGTAAWRPVQIVGTGRLGAIAIGLLAVIWVSAFFIDSYGVRWPSKSSAIVEASVAAVALAMAFATASPSGFLGDRGERRGAREDPAVART